MLTSAFSTEADIDSPNTLAKLYADFPSPDLQAMQGKYESLSAVNSESVSDILLIFVNVPKRHAFLVWATASTQHPDPIFHCLTSLQVMENSSHHLCNSIISWYFYIIESELPDSVAFDPTCIIPGEPASLTQIVYFDSTML